MKKIPVLWRKRHKLGRWLFLVLGCLAMAVVIDCRESVFGAKIQKQIAAAGRVFHDHSPVTELSAMPSGSRENVVIFDSSPNVHKVASIQDAKQMFNRNGDVSSIQNPLRGDVSNVSNWWRVDIREIKIIREGVGPALHIELDDYVESGCCSAILPKHSSMEKLTSYPTFGPEFSEGNECSLFGEKTLTREFCRPFSSLKLSFPSRPKLIGSQPEANCRNSEDYCESSNHALVVVLKEGIDSLENERRARVEGGAVFFIIVIGGLLIVLWLHQAKR